MCQMSDQINELAAAFAKAQAEMSHAAKDATNPHFRSDYATLASVLEATRPILAKHGLSVMQPVTNDEQGNVVVETIILHGSGQWMKSAVACRPQKGDVQGLGSTTTYLRRYSLASICGVAQADDDGEAASGRGVQAKDANPPMQPAKRQKQEPASPYAIQAADAKEFGKKLADALDAADTPDAVGLLMKENEAAINRLPREWQDELVKRAYSRRDALKAPAEAAE